MIGLLDEGEEDRKVKPLLSRFKLKCETSGEISLNRRTDRVLLIEGSDFATKSFDFLRCIHCYPVDMTLDAPKINTTCKAKLEPSFTRIWRFCGKSVDRKIPPLPYVQDILYASCEMVLSNLYELAHPCRLLMPSTRRPHSPRWTSSSSSSCRA